MGNYIDLTGQKFGKLTVIEKSDKKTVSGRAHWLCLCECGNKVIVNSNHLRSGSIKSCGCLHKHPNNFIDLTGQKFGKLTVIERDMQYRDKGVYWKCICECGNEKTILGKTLRSGATKSCGCLRRIVPSKVNTKNLIGQKFGKLTVIEKTEKSSCNGVIWKCICECGNMCEAPTGTLKSGDKQSCGCIGKSRGENKITNILKENNILFETEKKFSTCKFPSTNAYARFDFYINNQYLIEFDGKQHFLQSPGWGENLVEIQIRDKFKNQWCKENNIPLIRIPYTHVNDITLEDLQLNTSKFIVKDDI